MRHSRRETAQGNLTELVENRRCRSEYNGPHQRHHDEWTIGFGDLFEDWSVGAVEIREWEAQSQIHLAGVWHQLHLSCPDDNGRDNKARSCREVIEAAEYGIGVRVNTNLFVQLSQRRFFN